MITTTIILLTSIARPLCDSMAICSVCHSVIQSVQDHCESNQPISLKLGVWLAYIPIDRTVLVGDLVPDYEQTQNKDDQNEYLADYRRDKAINPLQYKGNYAATSNNNYHEVSNLVHYTGRWWVGCYIWYSEEGTRRAAAPPSPLLVVPNVHPSTASVPITVLLQYNGLLHYGFCMPIKGLTHNKRWTILLCEMAVLVSSSLSTEVSTMVEDNWYTALFYLISLFSFS